MFLSYLCNNCSYKDQNKNDIIIRSLKTIKSLSLVNATQIYKKNNLIVVTHTAFTREVYNGAWICRIVFLI